MKSRAGLERAADVLVDPTTVLPNEVFDGVQCVLVDEAQFISPFVIDQLRHVATSRRVPVICYGLRTDFRSRLFAGSKRLMELADSIEEVKTTCAFCNKKAVFNLKAIDGVASLDGASIGLGCEEVYRPARPSLLGSTKAVPQALRPRPLERPSPPRLASKRRRYPGSDCVGAPDPDRGGPGWSREIRRC